MPLPVRHLFFALMLLPFALLQPVSVAQAANLAVLPFENNAITDHERFEPLRRGLAAMLTSDLSKVQGLTLIERGRIAALLNEAVTSQGGYMDESQAIRTGQILGATNIAFGSFLVLGETVRIDTRIIKVETSELVMAESVSGSTDDFITLQQDLAGKIAMSLEANFVAERDAGSDIEAALAFSQGLDALDAGDSEAADTFFEQAVALDNTYTQRVSRARNQRVANQPATSPDRVEVDGYSAESLDDAIEQAQRSAVEQVVGVFIQSDTEMENFEIKRDRVLSQSSGYIRRFDILDSGRDDDGLYFAKIAAEVSSETIRDDLVAMNILLDRLDRPTVVVLVTENYVGMDSMGLRIAETRLTQSLIDRGFDLIDEAQLQSVAQGEQLRQARMGNEAAAQAIGLAANAQYIVLGTAAVEDSGEAVAGASLSTLRSTLQLKVMQAQTGRILGSGIETGVAASGSRIGGATDAIAMAVENATDTFLVDMITTAFQDFVNNGTPFKLNIEGVTSFPDSRAVSATIDELPSVVTASQDFWNRAGGLLVLDLRYRGSTIDLAAALDGVPVGDARFAVTSVESDQVHVTLELPQPAANLE